MSTATTAPATETATEPGTLLPTGAWVNVGVAALAMVATLPGRTHGLGLVTEGLLRDLHLDRVTYAGINLWATLVGALFCLPCGYLTDRLGPRRLLTAVVPLLGAVVLGMSGTATVALMAGLILLTRGLGQSALSVVSLALLGKSFGRHNARATGIYSALVGLGFGLSFKYVRYADTWLNHDWQLLWSMFGWVLVVGVAPLSWLLTRDPSRTHSTREDAGTDGLTLRQALRSPAFWAFGTATSLYGLIASGISLFNESVLAERGFGRDIYLDVAEKSSYMVLGFNLLGGWLAQRWPMGRLLGVAMLVLAGAMLGLPHLTTLTHVHLYAVAMAFAGGTVTVIFFGFWAHAYGGTHVGQIQGAAQTLTVFASAVGPLLLAGSKERYDSYAPLFQGLALAAALLAPCVWLVPIPKPSRSDRP
jgi:hypothetical protein